MKRLKEVKDLIITHGDVDEVKDGSLALSSFENKMPMNVSENKVVTFHAVDHIEVKKHFDADIIGDDTCEKDCNAMGDPAITGMSTINTKVDTEFDPMEGVNGYDDNGDPITVTVEEE